MPRAVPERQKDSDPTGQMSKRFHRDPVHDRPEGGGGWAEVVCEGAPGDGNLDMIWLPWGGMASHGQPFPAILGRFQTGQKSRNLEVEFRRK